VSYEPQVAFQTKNSPLPDLPLANVLGVGIHAVNLPWAADIIDAAIEKKKKGYVCVTSVHGVMEAHRNPELYRALASAMLVVPDGMPTVWVGRSQGHHLMRRVFGPDLMLELCRRSAKNGCTHFLYGGKPHVAEELAATLTQRFPGIKVVGTYTPPFRPLTQVEQAALKHQLECVDPDILWVGLSTPKQELFMARNICQLNCRVMVGVGAAFDIHTGRLNDSPNWVKEAGLQWLHRLCQEPSRLWKRYLINNSQFLARLTLQFLGLKSYELGDSG